jgi:hypothetical protein
MIARRAGPVTLWNAGGVPVRLIWEGRRYRVSDRPTPIRQSVDVPAMTHPLEKLIGYRMQIAGEDGTSVVVDVHLRPSGAELVAVYD